MDTLHFHIQGLDCPDEVAILRRQLMPLVRRDEGLAFDILNAKMSVQVIDDGITMDAVRQSVAQTGMKAVSWDEFCQAGVCALQPGSWQQRSRLVLCAVSGLLLALGMILEAFQQGGLVSLFSISGKAEGFPPPLGDARGQGRGSRSALARGGGSGADHGGAAGGIPHEGGIEAAYRRQLAEAEDPAALRAELNARIESARGPLGPVSRFQIEEIIDPRDTRRLICEWVTNAYSVAFPTGPACPSGAAVPAVIRWRGLATATTNS